MLTVAAPGGLGRAAAGRWSAPDALIAVELSDSIASDERFARESTLFKLHEKSVVLRQMPLAHKDYDLVVARFKQLYPDSGRRSQRLAYRIEGGIRFTIDPPDSAPTEFISDAIDLSSHGIGILHAGFVHFQTRCAVELVRLDGKRVGAAGLVRRCDCIVAPVHHVGIEFDRTIDITEFVNVVPADAQQDNAQLSAAVLEKLSEIQSEVDQLVVLVRTQADRRLVVLKTQTLRQLVQDTERAARGMR
jgi:hypothetical protein